MAGAHLGMEWIRLQEPATRTRRPRRRTVMSRLQIRFAWKRPEEVASYPPNRLAEARQLEARPPDTIALYEERPDGIQRLVGEADVTGDGYLGDGYPEDGYPGEGYP